MKMSNTPCRISQTRKIRNFKIRNIFTASFRSLSRTYRYHMNDTKRTIRLANPRPTSIIRERYASPTADHTSTRGDGRSRRELTSSSRRSSRQQGPAEICDNLRFAFARFGRKSTKKVDDRENLSRWSCNMKTKNIRSLLDLGICLCAPPSLAPPRAPRLLAWIFHALLLMCPCLLVGVVALLLWWRAR